MKSRIAFFAVATAFSSISLAQLPLADAENSANVMADQVRLTTAKQLQLTEPGVLYELSESMGGTKAWFPTKCQPLKGDEVKLLEFAANAGGVRGVNSARVKVAGGRCQNTTGWVGTTYLKVIG